MIFLELFDGSYPWESNEGRDRVEASTDPADHTALRAVDELKQAAWDWMEVRAPVAWKKGDTAQQLSDDLIARFPWSAGEVWTRLLNWAQWISWHEGLADRST